jgi:hypothetical protein
MAQPGSFIQVINLTTDRYDELEALDKRWQEEGTESTAQIITTCRNRDIPNGYSVIVEFPNYELAMQNSNLPKTQELAEQMQKLCTSIEFVNLDVIKSESM